jgi:hypothetical protein
MVISYCHYLMMYCWVLTDSLVNRKYCYSQQSQIQIGWLKNLVINAKKHSFWNFLDSSNPDIICGNETWLKPSICNSEILPDESDYDIFRIDRKYGFGGVMLAIKSNTVLTDSLVNRKYCYSQQSQIQISWLKNLVCHIGNKSKMHLMVQELYK